MSNPLSEKAILNAMSGRGWMTINEVAVAISRSYTSTKNKLTLLQAKGLLQEREAGSGATAKREFQRPNTSLMSLLVSAPWNRQLSNQLRTHQLQGK